jgi:sterol desaturase/sphingolipid hydroxylase (fatty acid hydroxylase superfamily)
MPDWLIPAFASAAAMSAIVAVRYALTSGGFALLTQRLRPGIYDGVSRQVRREIGWSLWAALIYGVPAGIVAWGWRNHGWTHIYDRIDAWPLWWWPASVLIYLIAHDAWFYWTHRWMHRPRLFRTAHAVHHASRQPTPWTAMSFHPLESLTGAIVIPVLVFLVPIHWSALAAVLAIMTFFGVTNHMGWEIFPRWLVYGPAGRWLITASHHQRHHRDYGCNFGLYFRHWDRLCETDRGLGEFGDTKVCDDAVGDRADRRGADGVG